MSSSGGFGSMHGRERHKIRLRVFEVYGITCYLCGDIATSVDHVTPPRYGGSRRALSNLRPSCERCGNRKGCRTLAEYIDMESMEWSK